jgi:molecular chaperone GrpE (heat shock protein)
LARANDFGADTVSRGESELRLPRVSAKLGVMNEMTNWKVPKWPFFAAYAVMLGFAYYFMLHAPRAVPYWELFTLCAACVAFGAVLSLVPFYLDYRATGKAIEVSALGGVAEKIQNLDTLSAQINAVTNRWETIQETLQSEAGKTSAAAKQIADKMAEEVRQFNEFMQKMNDSEKATLRLEVEKLHRSEGEWLQVIVRILDNIFALHTAAVRTGDPKFAEPIANFQNACRGTTRRIGLTPFIAEPDEKFNAELHQVAGSTEKPADGAVVAETIGVGYTFQGKLLRPALVRLRDANAAKPAPVAASVPVKKLAHENPGDELPL